MQPAMVFAGSQLSTTLSVTFEPDNVTVPLVLKMPPPWAALLFRTSLCVSVTSPPGSDLLPMAAPLATPPPSQVALLPFTLL